MSTIVPPPQRQIFGTTTKDGTVIVNLEWYRYLAQALYTRVGGLSSITLAELEALVIAAQADADAALVQSAGLTGGTAGQVLTKTSATEFDYTWQPATGSGSPGPQGPALFFLADDGQDGERGPPGTAGANGATGAPGAQGPAVYLVGEPGEDGNLGPPGAAGAAGAAGSQGAQGPQGQVVYLPGDPGEDGERGPPGQNGAAGAAGADGAAGPQGPSGPAIFLLGESAEPEIAWPGPKGETGATGAPGGGGGSATTVEVDFGSTAKFAGKFTITDAGISGTSKILCWQAPGPYTGKGTRSDEAEMQPVSVIAVEPGSGTAVVKWQTPPMLRPAKFPAAGGQPASAIVPGMKDPQAVGMLGVARLGKVRGNVKFTYMVI